MNLCPDCTPCQEAISRCTFGRRYCAAGLHRVARAASVRRAPAVAARPATAEMLAGVCRWGFESDAAAMAAKAGAICLRRFSLAHCVATTTHGPAGSQIFAEQGARLALGADRVLGLPRGADRVPGRGCPRHSWKRVSPSLVTTPARATARAALAMQEQKQV